MRLWSVPVWVLAAVFLAGPAWAQDEIHYTDRTGKRETVVSGTIQDETPGRVVYQLAAGVGTREVAAPDILDILYEVPGAVKLDYGRANAEERKASDPAARADARQKALADAIQSYQDVLGRLTGPKLRFARRHVQFKIARLLARQAEEEPSQTDAALDALAKFTKENPDGWQIGRALRLLARLQLAKGDSEGARKTYEELAATPNIAAAVRQEADLAAADALILGKRFAEARQKLEGLLRSVPADDPEAARIHVYLAECEGVADPAKLRQAVAQIEKIIAATNDRRLKATAYNALGDCYRLNGQKQEALWPYLWVDVIYHQDRAEHARALEQLARLFDELGDKARAKQYREKLSRGDW